MLQFHWIHTLLLIGALACGPFASEIISAEMTAFELMKEGNRYVGEDCKDLVVQVRSEKSQASLIPKVWYVVFYDPDARLKATEVKFYAGRKLAVKRPLRMIESINGRAEELLPRPRMKVDSDEAIKTATKEPALGSLKLTATQLWLDAKYEGPVWKVRLWAQKLSHPSSDVEIGDVHISAFDGKVIRRDLHLNRVD